MAVRRRIIASNSAGVSAVIRSLVPLRRNACHWPAAYPVSHLVPWSRRSASPLDFRSVSVVSGMVPLVSRRGVSGCTDGSRRGGGLGTCWSPVPASSGGYRAATPGR